MYNINNPKFIKFYRIFILFYRGQLPADAEFNFLDHAKRLDMYGVELHKARVCTYPITSVADFQNTHFFNLNIFFRIQQIKKYN